MCADRVCERERERERERGGFGYAQGSEATQHDTHLHMFGERLRLEVVAHKRSAFADGCFVLWLVLNCLENGTVLVQAVAEVPPVSTTPTSCIRRCSTRLPHEPACHGR